MRAFRLLSAVSLVALVPLAAVACSSSSTDGTAPTGSDTGVVVDSSVSDLGPADTGAARDTNVGGSDTAPGDAPKSDGKADTGGKTSCDPHPGDECNMVKQDCPDPTQTCDFIATANHNQCVKNPIGPGAKGDACSPSSGCDRGLFCYQGKCSPACCLGDDSACGAGGQCNLDITQPGDAGDVIIYHACTYAAACHPFKYDCPANEDCLWDSAPDSFACAVPSTPAAYSAVPNITCKYANDCGESQACFNLMGTDSGADYKCYLFCWLAATDAGTTGGDPKGRFAANGTCTVGGKSYGTCQSVTGIGGGLGLCL